MVYHSSSSIRKFEPRKSVSNRPTTKKETQSLQSNIRRAAARCWSCLGVRSRISLANQRTCYAPKTTKAVILFTYADSHRMLFVVALLRAPERTRCAGFAYRSPTELLCIGESPRTVGTRPHDRKRVIQRRDRAILSAHRSSRRCLGNTMVLSETGFSTEMSASVLQIQSTGRKTATSDLCFR